MIELVVILAAVIAAAVVLLVALFLDEARTRPPRPSRPVLYDQDADRN